MVEIKDLAGAIAAIELAISTFEKIAPTAMAAIEYLKKNKITDEDIANLKAQDKAAANNQQAAIDRAEADGR